MSIIYHPRKNTKIWWYKCYDINEKGGYFRKSLGTRDKSLAKYLQSKEDVMRTEHKRPTMNPEAESILHEYDLSVQKRKTKDTHYRDMHNIEHFLKTTLIQKISDITEKTLQDYFNKRRGDGIAPATVNRNMASIKTFLRFALRRRYIFVDPFVEIKKYPVPERLPRFFKTKDDIKKLLEEAKQTHLYPVVATAVYTGMRQAELFSLDWTDINFDTNTITVQNTERHTTKSKRIRVIPIHPALKAILKPLAQEKGRCFDTTNHKRVFRRIMQACGMPRDWRILRHTFASQLVMEGIDLPTVKDLLGHANISTTMIYSHLAPAHTKKSLEKLNFQG